MRRTRFAILGACLCAALLLWCAGGEEEEGAAGRASDVRSEGAALPQRAVLAGRGRPAEPGREHADRRLADPHPTPASTRTMLVRVIDAEDGHAIAGARVSPWPDCVTDAAGEVRVPIFEEPGFEIRIECRGYVPAVRSLYSEDAKLVALRRGVPLVGRVLDASSRAPVSDATVLLRDGQEATLSQFAWSTDDAGRFEVSGIAAGRLVEILVEIRGRAPTRTHVVMRESTTRVEVLVADGGVLEGRVERQDDVPADAVEVFLVPPGGPVPPRGPGPDEVYSDRDWHVAGAPHVRTASDGTFALAGVPTGRDFVAVAVLGELWEARSGPFRFTRPGQRLRLTLTAEEPATVSVDLAPGGSEDITLYAVSVRGPTLWAYVKWGPALDGPCPVRPLSPGAYDLTAHPQGAPDVHRSVNLGAGEHLDWTLAPETGNDVSGIVLDAEGRPQPEVMLLWRGERVLEGATGSDGSFRLDGVGSDAGELIALKWGPDGGECRLKDVAPGTRGLRMVLGSPEAVTVEVDGLPPDTRVTAGILTQGGTNVVSCRLDGQGHLTCPRPDSDAATLVLLAEGRAPVLIDLPSEERGDLVRLGPVRFDEGKVLEGSVLDHQGNPVAEADVWVAAWWSRARTKTDLAGAFRLAGLPGRPVLVGIQAPGAAAEMQRVEPRVGVTIRLSAVGFVEGAIESREGAPVAGATVRLTPVLDASPADDPSSGILTATTDARGRFRLTVAAGRWSASLESQGDDVADPVGFQITGARTSLVRLVLRNR